MAPMMGSSVIWSDKVHRMGTKAASVITLRTRSTPSPSMMLAKRMVSSCTRCAAPSTTRSFCQYCM
jgi:hypothetical protein